jgi:hypothetical protein
LAGGEVQVEAAVVVLHDGLQCLIAAVVRALELARYMAGYPQASIRSDREAILDSYGRSVDEGLALEDEARRRSLSDGVMP